MKTPVLIFIVSHVLFVAVGFFVRLASPRPAAAGPPAAEVPAVPVGVVRPLPGPVSSVTGEAPWTALECARAWYAVEDSDIPAGELAGLRDRIFREWARKDLRGALVAWTEEETVGHPGELGNAIQEAFDGHERDVLGWVQAGDFGLDGGAVLSAMLKRLEHTAPLRLFELLPDVPADFQERAMQWLFGTHSSPGPSREEMEVRIRGIAKLSDERLRTIAWRAALAGMANRGETQVHEFLAKEDIPLDAKRAAREAWERRVTQRR